MSVKILDIQKKPKGWDIYDAIQEGIDPAKFIAECPILENVDAFIKDTGNDIDDLNSLLAYDIESLLNLEKKVEQVGVNKNVYGFFITSFVVDIHAAHQVAGALYFAKNAGTDFDCLTRIQNTVWSWGEKIKCHRPLIDLTAPSKPFQPISFAHGASQLIKVFGSVYYGKNPETGKTIKKIFNRNATEAIGTHFAAYALGILPDRRDLLSRRPARTVSAKDCLLSWNSDCKDFDRKRHSPKNFLTLPAFPVHYTPWAEISEDRQGLLISYLDNLLSEEIRKKENKRIKNIEFFSFLIGFSLTPWRDKIVFVLIGDNDTGKTTFIDLCIRSLHAEGGTLKLADFLKMAKRPGDFDYAPFDAALVVEHDDFQPGGELPAMVLKHVANRNLPIEINKKFLPPYQTANTAMVIIGTNGNPRSTDSYLGSRLCCVPFQRRFTVEEQEDPKMLKLLDKIRMPEMRETIFSFGIEGLRRFWTHGLEAIMPESVRDKTDEVSGSLNDAISWINEAVASGLIDVAPTDQLRIKKSEMYELYRESHQESAMGRNAFYSEAAKRFSELKSDGVYYFTGVKKHA